MYLRLTKLLSSDILLLKLNIYFNLKFLLLQIYHYVTGRYPAYHELPMA